LRALWNVGFVVVFNSSRRHIVAYDDFAADGD
jgi:hypothetical protein